MGIIIIVRVVIGANSQGRIKTTQPGNRKWILIIQGINAIGQTILPYIIFKGEEHLSTQYEDNGLPIGSVIILSLNGQTTNKIRFKQIQHFNKHIKHRIKGRYRLLILNSHESHISAQFKQYYKEHEIIALYMPPYLSHLLQLLDVSYFSLKKALYGSHIEIRLQINYIIKLIFMPVFGQAF